MTIPTFQEELWSWYRKNKRSLPWRNTRDPYRILVSEVMLQQTQVARVLPKYREFLSEFPDVQALAAASDRKVLKVWQGLGYWKRALNLKKAAQQILSINSRSEIYSRSKNPWKMFSTPEQLATLPGVGPYTARALACFAFNSPEPFLDTNIRRVYLHFFFPKKKGVSDKEILKVAAKVNSKICCRKSLSMREWHYALFDYGALRLKDKKINKRSKHYARQSRFEGSFRSFRTKVMRFLLDQPGQEASLGKISGTLKKAGSPYSAERILASLLKDGLVKKKGRRYAL